MDMRIVLDVFHMFINELGMLYLLSKHI